MATFSNAAWDAARASRGKRPEQYCRCCLVDLNPPGQPKIKDNCLLPVRYTPGGPYVKAALRAASAALAGARTPMRRIPAAKRRSAAASLRRLMVQAQMSVGEHLRMMAGR